MTLPALPIKCKRPMLPAEDPQSAISVPCNNFLSLGLLAPGVEQQSGGKRVEQHGNAALEDLAVRGLQVLGVPASPSARIDRIGSR